MGTVTKAALFFSVSAMLGAAMPAWAGGDVNIYTYRQPELIEPVLDAFTERTGITANILFLDTGMIERMRIEGENSPADVIFTSDIARLDELKQAGVTQALADTDLEKQIPAKFRDKDKQWFALGMDARVVYASKARVKQGSITYEELADPQWEGRICLRDGRHSANLGLFASMIAAHGNAYAVTWLTGLKNNLARRPNGSDRTQAQAIFEGKCDIGIGNTYFIAAMLADDKLPDEKAWAEAVRVILPNAGDRGTYVNISGMALARYAPNRDNAIRLMEFLVSKEAQELYAQQTLEYPVVAGAAAPAILERLGAIKPDEVAMDDIARYRQTAADLVDKTSFNDGPDK
jgi:iron(III) transport system substrate-binding protein